MAQFVLPGSAVLDDSPDPERAFVLLLPDVGADAQLSVSWEKRTP